MCRLKSGVAVRAQGKRGCWVGSLARSFSSRCRGEFEGIRTAAIEGRNHEYLVSAYVNLAVDHPGRGRLNLTLLDPFTSNSSIDDNRPGPSAWLWKQSTTLCVDRQQIPREREVSPIERALGERRQHNKYGAPIKGSGTILPQPAAPKSAR